MKFILPPLLLIIAVLSCKMKKTIPKTDPDIYYTCSMHTQVDQDKPGKCPICGMQLIAVKRTVKDSVGTINLNDQQILSGNIVADTLRSGTSATSITLPATLSIDQNKTSSVSSRVSGRIEKLYYKNVGEYVPKNAKLFDIYSEELNSARQEYIYALEKENNFDSTLVNFNELVKNAKAKLVLWGVDAQDISNIEKNKKITPLTTFYNPEGGFITSFSINEGDYVPEGGLILNVAQLSTLWAEAQLYSTESSLVENNESATVEFADLPGYVIEGKIDTHSPEINTGTRLNLLKIVIPNKNNILKPGMAAFITIKNKPQKGLLLPADAVIRDPNGASVWLKTGPHTFKNKMVTIGMETEDGIEIKSGLQAGDVVIISGAYLLNSEYILKKGSSPMEGMDMGGMKM